MILGWSRRFFFFFNDTATTEIYTLSLHDALPISVVGVRAEDSIWRRSVRPIPVCDGRIDLHLEDRIGGIAGAVAGRSEEHTSELQSPCNLVCRLLLEKKKKKTFKFTHRTCGE